METLQEFFKKEYRLIFITGQSAAMKSQNAQRLSQFLTSHSIPHMLHSIGDLCRAKRKEDANWYNTYKDQLENAGLLPTEAITPLWLPHVENSPTHHHIIEGSPRSLSEAQHIELCLQQLKRQAILIHLHVHDDDALDYLRTRNVIEKRADLRDDETIRKKLRYYHTDVVPGIDLAISSPHFHVLYRHIALGETLEAVFQDLSIQMIQS
jgi:adenylate kinase family enzyme